MCLQSSMVIIMSEPGNSSEWVVVLAVNLAQTSNELPIALRGPPPQHGPRQNIIVTTFFHKKKYVGVVWFPFFLMFFGLGPLYT